MVTDTETAQNMKLASEIFEEHTDTIRAAIVKGRPKPATNGRVKTSHLRRIWFAKRAS